MKNRKLSILEIITKLKQHDASSEDLSPRTTQQIQTSLKTIKKPDLNFQDEAGSTALILACNRGPAMVGEKDLMSLLNEKISLKSYQNYNAIVKQLIESKANVNLNNHQKETPLLKAIHNTNSETVKLLLEAKADLSSEKAQELLLCGIYTGNEDIVNCLIAYKAQIEPSPKYLYVAIRGGNENIVQKVLDTKVEINNFPSFKRALRIKDFPKFDDIPPDTLCLYEEDINGRSSNCGLVVYKDKSNQLRHGSILLGRTDHSDKTQNKIDSTFVTPGCWSNDPEFINDILSISQFKVNGFTSRREFEEVSLLDKASMFGNSKIVKKLIEAKADLSQRNEDGMNTLMRAIIEGKTEIAKELIQAGAKLRPIHKSPYDDYEMVDEDIENKTMLMRKAIYEGDTCMVKSLLDEGVEVEPSEEFSQQRCRMS